MISKLLTLLLPLLLLFPSHVLDMAEQLPQEKDVTIEDLVLSHSFEMLALITVLEKKGILTREEIINVIKELRDTPS